jgi:hypothetical protein
MAVSQERAVLGEGRLMALSQVFVSTPWTWGFPTVTAIAAVTIVTPRLFFSERCEAMGAQPGLSLVW